MKPAPLDVRTLQRRTVGALAAGQVLGAIGTGATVSLGSMLIVEVSGSAAWSGMAATTGTLGAALFAVPLAALALRRGRRVSLSTAGIIASLGGAVVVAAAGISNLLLLFIGMALMGAAQALNLQARFAAADLADPASRGRDLSLVVWSTTLGVIIGPNLFEPGEALGSWLALPSLTGGFAISLAAQLLATVIYLLALRPDPLIVALAATSTVPSGGHRSRGGGLALLRTSPAVRRAVATVALAHLVMVALMSMTPVHMSSHGSSLTIVGVTISLHMAGMYALSPVFGWLTDRLGGRPVVLLGQGLTAGALLAGLIWPHSVLGLTLGLILLGLGWSAATVAGATLVTSAAPTAQRPAAQGISDAMMNVAGALGGALAGPVLAAVAYPGLSVLLIVPVLVVVALQAARRG
ncbi:MFS transporter [Zhihengliuella alba]